MNLLNFLWPGVKIWEIISIVMLGNDVLLRMKE